MKALHMMCAKIWLPSRDLLLSFYH